MAGPLRLGKYEIRRPLGRGAMGTVYLGFDPDIERLVALKTIRVDALQSETAPGFVARFRNEARAAGRLQHPNIVAIYEYGEDAAVAFIAMEYVEGDDLGTFVKGRAAFDLGQATELMRQLLEALEFAHRHGIVHRDIKPSNLLVTRDGTLKVADFGVARVDASQLTATGLVVGTPAYMSPEQCVGQAADARSDLFSAGVVLYELVTGARPFAGPPESVAYQICHENPVAPSRRAAMPMPLELDAVVATAMAREPAKRFPSAHAFRQALLRAVDLTVTAADVDATLAPGPPGPAPALPPNNLPQPVTSLVGREHELGEIARLLDSTRLLTLTGAGGLGKTRLAIESGRARVRTHRDGVFLVELAAIADPQLVAESVAAALDVRSEPGQPVLAALASHVASRALLLIVDNCEHLLDACADVVRRLLESGPAVRIVATSREPLRVGGEAVFPVPPLAAPEGGVRLAPDALARVPAVALFCDRARAADPHFRLSDHNATAIGDICQRLDGIPLALELAAARVRALPVEAIADRLGDRFRLLTGGDRTALPRQRTLRATIDWSYDLLSPSQQALLRRLSVFAGGFGREAAEAVGGGDGVDVDEGDVVDVLTDLVDKSLVVRDAERDRYGLLDTVRQYANEKLEGSGEGIAGRERHVRHFVALAEEGDPEIVDAAHLHWDSVLDRERENLLAAHAYCDAVPDGGALGLRLVHALRNWLRRVSLDLGRRAVNDALARVDATQRDLLRCRALFTAASICYFGGKYAEALRHADESLAIARELDDRPRVADALALTGLSSYGAGDPARAAADLTEAVALGRVLGFPMRLYQAVNCLAEVQSANGDLAVAQRNYEEALTIARQMGARGAVVTTLLNLVRIAVARGAVAQAVDLMRLALADVDPTGVDADGQQLLTVAAGLAVRRGDWLRAARLYGMAEAWLEKGAAAREPADASFVAPLIVQARAAAGDAAFADAVAAGRRLPFADALADIRGWLGSAT